MLMARQHEEFQFELTAVYCVYTLVLSAQEIQRNFLILLLVEI